MDGKHVVFGKVSEGIELLDELEEIETKGDRPTQDIKIVDCGVAWINCIVYKSNNDFNIN